MKQNVLKNVLYTCKSIPECLQANTSFLTVHWDHAVDWSFHLFWNTHISDKVLHIHQILLHNIVNNFLNVCIVWILMQFKGVIYKMNWLIHTVSYTWMLFHHACTSKGTPLYFSGLHCFEQVYLISHCHMRKSIYRSDVGVG